jgi:HemY protein
MRRIIVFLVVAAVVVVAAWWLSLLPGTVNAEIGSISFEAATPVVAVGLLVGFILLYATVRIIGELLFLPETLRRWRGGRRRRYGDVAVTRTLVALAAGETGDARREAARARRLIGDTPQTLLLAAEAGRIAGREKEAEAAFRALAEQPESAFLGYRGLLRQAMARQDWTEAAALARQAEAAHPGASWLRGERARLAIRTSAWSEALALADPDAPKAGLAAAAADAETDPSHALRLAKQAWSEEPSLVPAALAYARRLRESGRESRAQDVVRTTWASNPHPALAEFALASAADPMARLQEAKRLAQENPEHPESHLLLAQTSLAAGLTGEARHQAEAALAAGLDQRRVWLLMADIEEADRGDTEQGRTAQRDALRRAATAQPDPIWRCTACGTPHPEWRAACPVCATLGSVQWTGGPPGPARLAGPVRATEPADEVGAGL